MLFMYRNRDTPLVVTYLGTVSSNLKFAQRVWRLVSICRE